MKEQVLILLSAIKASLGKFLIIVAAFLIPIKPLILTVGICIAIDTFMGIWRAKKQKENITSRKLSNIISKMVLYDIAVILFYCIEHFILSDIIAKFTDINLLLTKLVAATLVMIELKSIDESFVLIKGYSLWTKFKELLTRAKSLKGKLEDLKEDKKD